MGLKLQLVSIFASLMTFVFVIKKIQKHGLNIDDAIMWILWSILLLIISVFPQIPTWISKQLGFMSTSNFIFCVFIFFLYIMLFTQTAQISKLKEKNYPLQIKILVVINTAGFSILPTTMMTIRQNYHSQNILAFYLLINYIRTDQE